MKRTLYSISAALVIAASAISCEVIEQPGAAGSESSQEPGYTLTATIEEDSDTKTSIGELENGNYGVLWSEDDRIRVYSEDRPEGREYVLTEGAGLKIGSFTGPYTGENYLAVYPSSIGKAYENGRLTVELPSDQYYVPDTFGPGVFPMIGSGTEGSAKFKNLCSLFRIRLKGLYNIMSITVKAHDSSVRLCGTGYVSTSNLSSPRIVMTDDSFSGVTLNVGGKMLSIDEFTDFYIVIPSQTYKGGFDVTIMTDVGPITRSVGSDISFKRSEIRTSSLSDLKTDNGLSYSLLLDGLGTEESPLLIKSLSDLLLMRAAVNSPGMSIRTKSNTLVDATTAFYRLENDIDLYKVCHEGFISWTPIGNNSDQNEATFKGSFDGNGHKITNLYINEPDLNGQALFGWSYGTIRNLDVSGSVRCFADAAGIVCTNIGDIINCINRCDVYTDDGTVGGICSESHEDFSRLGIKPPTIISCANYGRIEAGGYYYAGGIAGSNEGIAANCSNFGHIIGRMCGGIAGETGPGWIINSINVGEIGSDDGWYISGGIAGYRTIGYKLFQYSSGGPQYANIENCVNGGTLHNQKYSVCYSSNLEYLTLKNNYWLYDPEKGIGEIAMTQAMQSGQEGNYAMTLEELAGTDDFTELLYTSKSGIPCYNIVDAMNNWAFDHRMFENYKAELDLYGWEKKSGSDFISLTGKSAVPGGGDITSVFRFNPRDLYVSFTENTETFTVITGDTYSIISSPSWAHQIYMESVDNNGIRNDIYTYRFDANNSSSERSGSIVFRRSKGETEEFHITQSGSIEFEGDWMTGQFFHRSLGMRFTADWCQYCPALAEQWKEAQAQSEGHFEMVAMHPSSSSYGNMEVDRLVELYNITGYPTGILDARTDAYYASSVLSGITETETGFGTDTGISLRSEIMDGNEISADIAIYPKRSGDYKVTVLLLEDGIIGYQSGYGDGFSHDNIIRGILTDIDGDHHQMEAGKPSMFRVSCEIPEGCNTGKLKVLVYVQKPSSKGLAGYVVDNCRALKLGESGELEFTADSGHSESTDYSLDGNVTELKTATRGKGINVVITGDGFMDKDQSLLRQYASRAMNAFFGVEPYTSTHDRFNFYLINAVSKHNVVDHPDYETKFSTYFGEGTLVGGDNDKIFSFVESAMPGTDFTKTLVIVLVNSKRYAGTNYSYGDNSDISFVPLQTNIVEFDQTLRHEAAGHGFGKLDDEYGGNGEVTQERIDQRTSSKDWAYGFWENTDFTSDSNSIKWAKYLKDERYSGSTGVFEGGSTYDYGVWRPTQNSIMRYNTGCFNAPSRAAIYKKIMKFSEGDGWTFDFEEFAEFDAKGREDEAYSLSRTMAKPAGFVPLAPPVLIRK